ncbi:DMT family transporter [Tropicimonas sp. TH_r6]|uniref:DMT family transporter n=1 Tax=Tropicimonas sp. TH_r6 TaxID=3082085 RepID=UPI002954098F|nr:DMT family transporter [Tropicimonas sp. TH_r6]MDV7142833.1 DMT family transporter [Tropicimonas sp. TH_r6]
MPRKDRIDMFGALALIGFSAFLGFNQVVIKVVNEGLQPVFWAGLRSAGAVPCIWLLMRLAGKRPVLRREIWPAGLLIGVVFTAEFLLLFKALDLTTVTRSSVIFYSMPVWFALAAHVLLPGERLTRNKIVGLLVAFAGVVWAIVDRGGGAGEASLAGDLCALGAAFAWAGIALCARGTKLVEIDAQSQLFWQVAVSAPLLLAISPLFGAFLRDPEPVHWWGLALQVVLVVSVGFTIWLWLLSVYPPASVAAFSFLTPIFGVSMGWLILGEEMAPGLLGALALVTLGLVLMNRQVPQKVR